MYNGKLRLSSPRSPAADIIDLEDGAIFTKVTIVSK